MPLSIVVLFREHNRYLAYSVRVKRALMLRVLLEQFLDPILPGGCMSCLSFPTAETILWGQKQKSSDTGQKEAGPALATDSLNSTAYFYEGRDTPLYAPWLTAQALYHHYVVKIIMKPLPNHLLKLAAQNSWLHLPHSLGCRLTPLCPWRLQLTPEPVTKVLLWLNNKFLSKTVKVKTSIGTEFTRQVRHCVWKITKWNSLSLLLKAHHAYFTRLTLLFLKRNLAPAEQG